MTSENAKQEIAVLTRLAADTRLTPAERAQALLTAHQRFDAGSCLCGWAEIGKSHAAHQADELARMGLLVAADHHARLAAGTEDPYEGYGPCFCLGCIGGSTCEHAAGTEEG